MQLTLMRGRQPSGDHRIRVLMSVTRALNFTEIVEQIVLVDGKGPAKLMMDQEVGFTSRVIPGTSD